MGTRNYAKIDSLDELTSHFDRLLAGDGPIGLDIETGFLGPDREKFSLHPETAIVVGFSFTDSLDWARYVPLRHDEGENLDSQQVARLLWPVLATGRAVIHNAAFELRHLSRWFREHLTDDPEYGEAVRESNGYFPIRSDTMIEAYLAAEYERFGLKALTKSLFDHAMTELHELFPGLPKNKQKTLRFNILPLTPETVAYACEDSVWCLAIHERYYPQVKDRFLYAVEMQIITVVCEMEDFGLVYDWAYMRRAAEALRVFRDQFNSEIMAELSELTGAPVGINLASPPQVSKVLYEQLGLTTTVYTTSTRDKPKAERKMSTGAIALAGLSKQHPVVKRILQWKEQTKLLTTYLEKYENSYSYADDGRVHPNHLSAFVITGRFAVSDPPYQGSPKKYQFRLNEATRIARAHEEAHGSKCVCFNSEFKPPPGTEWKFNFRDSIVAPPDHYILGFDLSQAELRAIAGEAQETMLLRAFEAGQDVHTLTAALMLRVAVEDVTKEQRDIGKTLNFALLYGMGAKSLGERLGIPTEEAQALFNKYFDVYAGIAAWSERQVKLGRTNGYVTSKFGRRLPIWEFKSDKRWIQEKGERACVNYPIQGSATGDAVKIGMVRARNAIRAAGLQDRVHLVMNVHDALELYVHRSLPPQDVIKILQPAVIFPISGWPSMKADWHIAKKWGSPVELIVEADGRVLAKADKEYELQPTVERDEETGEEVEALPDVDLEVLRQVIAAPQFDDEGEIERQIIIELTEMPDEAAYDQFTAYLDAHPGLNTITLRTPEGEFVMDRVQGVSLTPAHTREVSLILGSAKVFYAPSDVDADELLRGLSL